MRLAQSSLLLLAGAALSAEVPEFKPRAVPLKRVALKPGTFLPSALLKKELPAEAWAAALPRRKYLLFDLDGDHRITPGGGDGLAIEGIPFVVPLPEVLLCECGQCRLEVSEDGSLLKLAPEDLSLPPALVVEASDLTEIRVRAGLSPVRLDLRASRDLQKHFEYLKLNGELDGHSGIGIHAETEGKPGWSAEGAYAGSHCVLFPASSSLRDALWMWRATAWHAAPLLGPGLGSVGVGFQYNVAGLYPVDLKTPDAPLPQPPDRAKGVPCRFSSRGETPSPTPNLSIAPEQQGYPVLVLLPGSWRPLPLTRFTLAEAAAGKPVEGTSSCPASPANPSWPTNSACAVFIPSKPLHPSTAYRARLEMKGCEPLEWVFTTAER